MKNIWLVLLMAVTVTACSHTKKTEEPKEETPTATEELKTEEATKSEEKAPEAMEEVKADEAVEDPKAEEMPKTEEKTTESEDDAMKKNEESVEAGGAVIVPYTKEKYETLKGNKSMAIFFHADWCPTCIKLQKALEENLADLPKDSVILIANYDKEDELKKEFEIATQSTLVFVDKTGKPFDKVVNPSIEKVKALLAK